MSCNSKFARVFLNQNVAVSSPQPQPINNIVGMRALRVGAVQYPCNIQKHVITYFCAVSYCAFEGRQSCKELLHMLEQKLQKTAKSQK